MLLDFSGGYLEANPEDFPNRLVLQIFESSEHSASCSAIQEGHVARLAVDHPVANRVYRIELLAGNLGLDDSGDWDELDVRMQGLTWRGDGTATEYASLEQLMVRLTFLNGGTTSVSLEVRAWFPDDVGPDFDASTILPTLLRLDWDSLEEPLGEDVLSADQVQQAAQDMPGFDDPDYQAMPWDTETFTSRPLTGFSLLPDRPTKPAEDKGAPRYDRDLDI